jgi:uncharacterized membrane protein YedE/YeeE
VKNIVVFSLGLLFAIGLGISGMTNANKVIAFLDLTDNWDPSLAFVMVGAIGSHLLLLRIITKRPSPRFAEVFRIPTRTDIDGRLIIGALLFGAGWAIGGYCPGPGIVSAMSLTPQSLIFVGSMIAGMLLFQLIPQPQ